MGLCKAQIGDVFDFSVLMQMNEHIDKMSIIVQEQDRIGDKEGAKNTYYIATNEPRRYSEL